MDCLFFDEIGNHIAASDFNEAEYILRTSSGRHYYFIYHTVKDWLELYHSDIIKNMGGSSHEKLRFCMEELMKISSNKKFGMVALKLNNLHRIRVHADYLLDDEFTDWQLKLMKSEKIRICELLKELERIQ